MLKKLIIPCLPLCLLACQLSAADAIPGDRSERLEIHFDGDGDGTLSADEKALLKAALKTIDRNGNGKISQGEINQFKRINGGKKDKSNKDRDNQPADKDATGPKGKTPKHKHDNDKTEKDKPDKNKTDNDKSDKHDKDKPDTKKPKNKPQKDPAKKDKSDKNK